MIKKLKDGVSNFLIFSLLASCVSGDVCYSYYDPVSPSDIYSTSFNLTDQYVSGNSYVYYYFRATAGNSFSVIMTPAAVDLDLIGSQTSITFTPTARNYQYYPAYGGTSTETITVNPTIDECYAFGVYGWNGNSGYYSISINVTQAIPPSTDSPTNTSSSQSICKQVLEDSPLLNYIEGDFSSENTILVGSYSYFYYSADSYSDIVIKLQEASFGTAADVDLFLSDASNNVGPTASNYEYSSATEGSTIESIEISSSSAKCFAIAVSGRTSGSYRIETKSSSDVDSSNMALILGLSIGLPVSLCCIILVSIGIRLCTSNKSPRRLEPAPVVMMNKSAAGGGAVINFVVGRKADAVELDVPPSVEVELPSYEDLPPAFEGESDGAEPEYNDEVVPPGAYNE